MHTGFGCPIDRRLNEGVCVNHDELTSGRVLKAPENFLSKDGIKTVVAQARGGRRDFIRNAFAAAVAGAAAPAALSQVNPVPVEGGDANILVLPEHAKGLGLGVATDGYGKPSKYEANVQRRQSPGLTQTTQASVSFAPLQSLVWHRDTQAGFTSSGIIRAGGTLTLPSTGSWSMGWSRTPKVFTMDEIMRLPSVSRFHFIECGANTAAEWGNVAVPTVQYTHGMISCSEFTGVPLITLLEIAGADLKNGKFVLAEGGEGSSMTRTIPMGLILSGEVLVAYGQNGEMLRPENGYPLRLVVPGVQGVSWIKYLRRVEVGDKPYGTKDEAIHYIDLQPDGTHRQYTSIQECKSVVTTPSGGQVLLDKGFYNITGLAWSGKGKIKKVDVSVDGGRNWRQARLETPVLSKAFSRFNIDWVWDGKPAIIQSRAVDETGYVQPTYKQLRAVRGTRSIYHNNAIQSWLVQENGEVKNVQLS
jgi:sulfane dehydrogenase subunit SoxC